jgi:hypothetical protein
MAHEHRTRVYYLLAGFVTSAHSAAEGSMTTTGSAGGRRHFLTATSPGPRPSGRRLVEWHAERDAV